MPEFARLATRPLWQLYKNELAFVGPLTQFGPDGVDLYQFYGNQTRTVFMRPTESLDPDVSEAMRNRQTLAVRNQPSVSLPGVQYGVLQKVTTVIAQAFFGNGSEKNELFRNVTINGHLYKEQMTVGQFMGLPTFGQMQVIDQAWNKVCERKPYSTRTEDMVESVGAPSAGGRECLPSGVIPKGAGYDVFKSPDISDGKLFTKLGIGFRVEGSVSGKDTERVLAGGMMPLVKVPSLISTIRGFDVTGTIVALDTSCARFWTRKNDIFNESAVCVARNFFGATGFPLRGTKSNDVVLWAVDVLGLTGCDTEQHQVALGDEQWRPGEKAYEKIAANRLVAHIAIQRTGLGPGDKGWKFHIPSATQWRMSSFWDAQGRYGAVKRYLDGLLAAWKGREHAIPQTMDFANK